MYKGTHKASQGRADRITIADLQTGGVSDLTKEQRLEMLQDKSRMLHLEMDKLSKNDPNRKRIGKAMFVINTEISKLKGPKTGNISQCFIDAAHNLLLPEAYDRIYREAEYISQLRASKQTYNAIERRTEMQIQDALKSTKGTVTKETI